MKRKKVEKQNQNSKKLLEDINNIVNEGDGHPAKIFGHLSPEDLQRGTNGHISKEQPPKQFRAKTKIEAIKEEIEKLLKELQSGAIKLNSRKILKNLEEIIKDKNYNVAHNVLKILTLNPNQLRNEEYIQEINIPPNKNRVSVSFRYDENIDSEIKSIIKRIENLNSDKQAKLINIVSSTNKMNPKDADELATQ